MKISLENVGKRYGRDWIFRKINYTFSSGKSYAILGPNGSGKSTLLQVLSLYQSPTEGEIIFSAENKTVAPDDVFSHITICAPYMQLMEEFTLEEQFHFHFNFKKPLAGLTVNNILEESQLHQHAKKQIKNFSSGMKQRVKLCLAIFSNVPVLLLDEPATNLDEEGIKWYQRLLQNFLNGRLLIISSNRKDEYQMCNEILRIESFK